MSGDIKNFLSVLGLYPLCFLLLIMCIYTIWDFYYIFAILYDDNIFGSISYDYNIFGSP